MKEKYREDVKKFFDIASKDLVDRLKKNRFLVDRKKQEENQKEKLNEDLAFLDDQYGARVFSMGSMDVEYADKVSNKENKQLAYILLIQSSFFPSASFISFPPAST